MPVVDPHAFRQLWPWLGVWLVCFVTAGDGVYLLKRQAALLSGRPEIRTVRDKRRERVPFLKAQKRDYLYLVPAGRAPVGKGGYASVNPGDTVAVHAWRDEAYLDRDYGYSRFKLGLFGAVFAGLWLWAAARYRFG
jgi:hypothetical protein